MAYVLRNTAGTRSISRFSTADTRSILGFDTVDTPCTSSVSALCTAGTERIGRIPSVDITSTRSTLNIRSILGVWSIFGPFVHRFDNSISICLQKIFTD